MQSLFDRLLAAGTEGEVQSILDSEGLATDDSKWTPYGNNESFDGVVENQQAHPTHSHNEYDVAERQFRSGRR